MPGQTSEDLLALYRPAPLNARYWWTFILMSAVFVFDFFDFLVVGYLLAVVGPVWHLTYGESAVILYSGGIGAIVGALVFGAFSDAWGRKPQIVIGTFICAVSSGLIAFIPEGAWWLFAILRFFVGVGLTAAVTPSLTVVVELTPTRHRTVATSFYVVFASAGGFPRAADLGGDHGALRLASGRTAGLCRGNYRRAGLAVHARIGALARRQGPVCRGARRGCQATRPAASIRFRCPPSRRQSCRAAICSTCFSQPRMFWETMLIWGGSSTAGYGVYLWGPTIVALLLKVPVPQAAKYFVFVAGAGVAGKIVVTFLAPLIGRRLLGVLWGFGGVVALAAAGYYNGVLVSGLPLLVILLCCSTFCIEGGFSNLAPYTVESYGVSMGARSSGLGQTANGVGKILGPFSLALIAGTSNIVSPHATEQAVFPAFLFLAFCMALVGLSFLILGVETHGKAMAVGALEGATQRPPRTTVARTEAR